MAVIIHFTLLYVLLLWYLHKYSCTLFCGIVMLRGKNLIFSSLALWFIRWDQNSPQYRTNYLPLPRQHLSEYFTHYPMNHEVFQCDFWVQELFWSCISARHSSSTHSRWFCPWSKAVSSHAYAHRYSTEDSRKTLQIFR